MTNYRKQCHTLWRFLVFIFSVFSITACTNSRQTIDSEYSFITKPLYINNNLYISNVPLLEKQGELYIPLKACEGG